MTDPQPLADLLDTLSRATTLLTDPQDREAAGRLASALRQRWSGTGPVRVLLVTGPGADPVAEWLSDIRDALSRARDELRQADDHVEALYTEMGQRVRLTAERDRYRDAGRRAARAWRTSEYVSGSGELCMAMAALEDLVGTGIPAPTPGRERAGEGDGR